MAKLLDAPDIKLFECVTIKSCFAVEFSLWVELDFFSEKNFKISSALSSYGKSRTAMICVVKYDDDNSSHCPRNDFE